MKTTILNIQKYSIHDGEGIRTTIFFKGCPLNCLWCHNPESQSYKMELLFNEDKCLACGSCACVCAHKANQLRKGSIIFKREMCQACGNCVAHCLQSAREVAGKELSLEDLMAEIDKDKQFYETSHGGVTLSGGEVMAQPLAFLLALLKKCHRLGYRVNIDTCGYAPFEKFQGILPYVDTFLYDIKLMDSEKHKELTGVDNFLILENLKKLIGGGAKVELRLPLIEGINTDHQNIEQVAAFISQFPVKKIHLLPYHSLGEGKYKQLGMAYTLEGGKTPSKERLEAIQKLLESHGGVFA